MDDIVECTMPEMVGLTHPAAEAMNSELVHLRATMLAKMLSADGGAELEGCCDMYGIIVHAKTDGRDGQCLQPCTGFLAGSFQKPGTSLCIGSIVDKVLCHRRHDDAVPVLSLQPVRTLWWGEILITRPRA